MAIKAYDETKIAAIADKIREKTGTETTYKTAEMPSGIDDVFEAGNESGYNEYENNIMISFLRGNETSFIMPQNQYILVDYAFYFHGVLKTVIVPENSLGYGRISNFCFSYCISLSQIELPDHIYWIGQQAFAFCTALTEFKFPKSLIEIKKYAFRRCPLTRVVFRSKLNNIEATAFYECTSITDIYAPWSEGEVAGAPWGATNATIHYDYTGA